MEDRHLPAIKPLTARSVAISTLLGYHPPELPISALVRVGSLFGIAPRTTRVALTRMAADGDVTAENGMYRLTERLVRRQAQQDEACSPQTREWDGRWEMAVVTASARPLAERVALRKNMVELRLGELREGVWIRPDNLLRKPGGAVAEQCTFFSCHYPDPLELARSVWDLAGWATEARRLCTELDRVDGLTAGFMVSAEVLRHLLIDPCLPAELLPSGWPGDELRRRYTEFNAGYAQRLREYSVDEPAPATKNAAPAARRRAVRGG
ncbi:PaaX domain-containing protein, C- domain protein [Amycolatopsis acidiphila]|uniref:PaaX family transcriptional regulator C-terminal domain-containing protein n=1 Tax=Amycolatopsis acidiphila TaxID=715473 RepID=UPI001C93B205|nr:PaaX family transcriptional regulator C-terminal domain-containing protein [Amycolatopsis acidiphila]UIJ57700.1 PaaX domain-containing protein, C- domain protein [Amycolatopsis acidiphila]